MKKIIKKLIKKWKVQKSGWKGNYSTWDEAEKYSNGYDSEKIVEKVLCSTLKVRSGEAIFERDSVLFNEIEYSQPMLLALLLACKNKSIKILDFGGALGSHYYQNKSFLKKNYEIDDISWNIIEQKKYVDIGIDQLTNDELKFFYSIEEYQEKVPQTNIIILSGVLSYLENYEIIIEKLCDIESDYIIVDRTLMCEDDIITVQTVPDHIYKASYPCRIFSKEKLINKFNKSKKYEIIMDYKSNIDDDVYINEKVAISRGIILKKIGG